MGKTVAAIVGVVAAIAIAVVAPYLAPIALGALGITATATAVAIATAVISIALSLAVGLAFKALGVGAPSAKDAVGPPQVFRQTITNSFIAYGKRRVGGLLVFFHSRQSGDDHYRYFVIAVAGHRSKQVDQWRLGDEVVSVDGSGAITSGKYAGAAWLWFQRGLASETANATFVSECGGRWTSAHKGNGVTAIYAKFKMTDSVVQAGMPNMTADIEGRDEILDPRDATTKYTDNGALVFYDFMAVLREEGGFGAYADEIPDDDWISAQANVCDETVDGEARYALDGVIQTGAPPADVRDAMIVNLAGTYAYSGGKHLMRPGYWVPSSGTLDEGDLAGPIQVSPMLTGDIAATEVNGTFIDPASGYQGQPLPTWDQEPAPADVKQIDVDLAFITSLKRGARILAIMGKRAQCEKQVVWPMNVAGIRVRAMDTWTLGTSRYGLSNYAWVVANWSLSSDPDAGPGVVLSMREENADIYGDAAVFAPTAPDPIIQPTSPLLTTEEVTQKILTSSIEGLSFSVNTSGDMTISTHTRIYTDKSVSVTGATVTHPASVVAGDLVAVVYRDAARAGGAVTYQAIRVVPGDELPKASPSDPFLHAVAVGTVPASGTTGGGSTVGSGGGGGGGGGGWTNPTHDL